MGTEKVPMGPPPIPNSARSLEAQSSSELISTVTSQLPRFPMGPPPVNLKNTTAIVVSSEDSLSEKTSNQVDNLEMEVPDQKTGDSIEVKEKKEDTLATHKSKGFVCPYTIPSWSEHSGHPFYLEVLKDGIIIEQLDVSKKGAYMFGRVDLCDFVLEHPTISRFHAVLQFNKSGEAFLYDLSTHGTSINKSQVTKKVYTDLHVGDVIRFGQSSRLYIFMGPVELMPEESDLGKLKKYKIEEEIKDREASLLRARVEASLAEGISWGMEEDAPVEEDEDYTDEVTWQTYKGQLTDRQEKTRSKIIKRMEKIANMRKEIDAIRAKDIAQGGLTQGQQTQIARNEQRTSQIMEELESLEETLNQSIQESIGARVKKTSHSQKRGTVDEEEEIPSDDDDFYDRTKKTSLKKSIVDPLSVETADTLLDKKEQILRDIEERIIMLQKEKTRTMSEAVNKIEKEDALDVFMTDLSSELALDVSMNIQKEITALQSDLERIVYLLKIADPTGEVARKRDSKPCTSNPNELCSLTSSSSIPEKIPSKIKKISNSEKSPAGSEPSQLVPSEKIREKAKDVNEETKNKTPSYAPMKPQWLGAVKNMETVDSHVDEPVVEKVQEPGRFIDYKDRKKALAPAIGDHEIEDAAPGLILRKRKHTEVLSNTAESTAQDSSSSSSGVVTTAADAVALLLKHKRGYCAGSDELDKKIQENKDSDLSQKKSHVKRVLGPEKPAFLENNRDYESWVPPKGQSGDGRTSLNDKFGY